MRRPTLSSTAPYIAWYAQQTPEATAIVEAGVRISYRRLAADLIRCMHALQDQAVELGTLVGIAVPGRYLQLLLILACEVIGATMTSLTHAENSGEDSMSRYCDVILTGYAPAAGGLPRCIVIPSGWLAALTARPVHDDDLVPLQRVMAPDAVTRIIKTSGTTGRPKAMPLLNAAQQLRITAMMARVAEDVLPTPRYLGLYSIMVNGVCMRVFGTIQHGGTVIFAVESQARELVAAGAVNYTQLAVGDCERMAQAAWEPPPGHRIHVEVFGAAVSIQLRQLIRQRLSDRLTVNYSSNEMSSITVVGDDDIGTLCPGIEVRIVDEAGRDKPYGEIGRIRIRGRTMVHSYFDDPALTATSFIDGWFQTSDLGRMDQPGRLAVLGRDDDMLNIGGIKVHRQPLEARIRALPAVRDAAVMSVMSRNEVGILLAAIETETEQPAASLTEQVGAILASHVRRYEIMPLRWFPRSESGKVRRTEIEAMFRRRQTGEEGSAA